jgi:hypothetical protein
MLAIVAAGLGLLEREVSTLAPGDLGQSVSRVTAFSGSLHERKSNLYVRVMQEVKQSARAETNLMPTCTGGTTSNIVCCQA